MSGVILNRSKGEFEVMKDETYAVKAIDECCFEKNLSRYVSALAWMGLFLVLYIFFRYVHPAIIWDGDDWHTNDFGTAYILFTVPDGKLTNYNVLSNALGSLFGYIAAFVVYPIAGDYIMSYAVVDAVARAAFIVLSNYIVWRQLYILTSQKVLPWCGTTIFLISGFAFMKTTYQGHYLFWTYNRCAVYYYCIPSYLASAFSLFLARRYLRPLHTEDGTLKSILRNASLMIALYFLMFSFFPAAVLITVVALVICTYDFALSKNIKNCIKRNWLCVAALVLFVFKVWFEYSRTFASGYFTSQSNLLDAIDLSARTIFYGYINMHPLFKIVMWSGIIFAADSMVRLYNKEGSLKKADYWLPLLLGLAVSFLMMLVFFILFGAVSYRHIASNNILRNDTLYCMQFLLLMLVSISWLFVLKVGLKVTVLLPIILSMLLCVAINPGNAYSDSVYIDTTPNQKYEMMSAIENAIREKSEAGKNALVIHMPAYKHWGSSAMSGSMQLHNLIDSYVNTTYIYDANPGDIWFE